MVTLGVVVVETVLVLVCHCRRRCRRIRQVVIQIRVDVAAGRCRGGLNQIRITVALWSCGILSLFHLAPQQLIQHLHGTKVSWPVAAVAIHTRIIIRVIIIAAVLELLSSSCAVAIIVWVTVQIRTGIIINNVAINNIRGTCTVVVVHVIRIATRTVVAVVAGRSSRRKWGRMTAYARAAEQTEMLLRCLAKDSPV